MEIKVGDVTAKWDEYALTRVMDVPSVEFTDQLGAKIAVPVSLIEAVARQL